MDVKSLSLAADYTWDDIHDDGHWYGELKTNATITAEYVMLYQALGLTKSLDRDREELCQWFLSCQNPDGSWAIAPNYAGDVSTTTEAYLLSRSLASPPKYQQCSKPAPL